MTFDNGQSIGSGSVTEQAIRLIVQAIITLAVIGAWFYLLTQDKAIPAELVTTVVAVILSWFGQGIAGTIAGYKRDQAAASLEHARALQITAQAKPIENEQSFTRAVANRIGGRQ